MPASILSIPFRILPEVAHCLRNRAQWLSIPFRILLFGVLLYFLCVFIDFQFLLGFYLRAAPGAGPRPLRFQFLLGFYFSKLSLDAEEGYS